MAVLVTPAAGCHELCSWPSHCPTCPARPICLACGVVAVHSTVFSGLQQGLGELQCLPCAALKANAIGMCPGDGQQTSGTKTERDRERLLAGLHSGPAVNPG